MSRRNAEGKRVSGPVALVWKVCIGVSGLVLLGCGDGATGPGRRVSPLGDYQYAFQTLPTFGSIERRWPGTLRLTYATPDSVAGSWSVPTAYAVGTSVTYTGYEARLGLGFWNVDAYVVYAYPGSGEIVVHRLTPRAGGFDCDAHVLRFVNGSPSTVAGTCTIAGPP